MRFAASKQSLLRYHLAPAVATNARNFAECSISINAPPSNVRNGIAIIVEARRTCICHPETPPRRRRSSTNARACRHVQKITAGDALERESNFPPCERNGIVSAHRDTTTATWLASAPDGRAPALKGVWADVSLRLQITQRAHSLKRLCQIKSASWSATADAFIVVLPKAPSSANLHRFRAGGAVLPFCLRLNWFYVSSATWTGDST